MNPLVSISCITYNHEKFIRQCLDGFLMQKTNFDFEILLHDDASTDDTAQIIAEYSKEFSGLIKPIVQEENQWSKGQRSMNATFNFPRAKGKYIALCEGDDYWTDPLKLQKQVDILEADPSLAASFHDVDILFTKNKVSYFKSNFKFIDKDKVVNLEQFLQRKYHIPTCSFLFRKEKLLLPPFAKHMNYGDFVLFSSVLLNSKAYVINDRLGVYRKNNPRSLTNNKGLFDAIRIKADYIQFLTWLMKYADKEDQTAIETRIYEEVETIRKKVEI